MARTASVTATRLRYSAEACRSAIGSMPASAALDSLAHRAFVEALALQLLRHRIEPQRHGGRRTDADGRARAAAVGVERDLRRGRHERKIALPRVDLVEAHADPRLRPHREARLREAGGQRQRGHHRDRGRNRTPPWNCSCRPSRQTNVAPSVAATSTISAAASPLASEPPTVPRARVAVWPTKGITLASSGSLARMTRVAFDHMLPGRGADRDLAALVAHISKARYPRDVDDARRPGQPHRHQRHQRLPAGDHPRAIVGRQQRAGLVDVGGTRILERRHDASMAQCQYGG